MIPFLFRSIAVLVVTATSLHVAVAAKVTGDIVEKQSSLPVSEATVQLKGIAFTVTGADGFFSFAKLPVGNYLIIVSASGYRTESVSFSVNEHQPVSVLHIALQQLSVSLDTVHISRVIDPSLEVYGRLLEKASVSLLHVISRQSIERSSDITVADMMQRVSGVSVIRDESGSTGKAIIRGMDPKYSHTTVNGMAVPSPNERNRFLSLDLFPSGIIDRLEVYKTLTAEMAGDAIGGLINIVTRPVPGDQEFSVQLATGYNSLFFKKSYLAFHNGVVQPKSPYERFGSGYLATGNDFTKDNLSFYTKVALPDIHGNISWSKRFFSQKLGVMFAGGVQTIRSGSDGFFILQNNEPQIGNVPGITDFIKRQYSNTSNRKNIYAALDYKISENNHLKFYQLYVNKLDIESRDAVDSSLSQGRSGPGTGRISVMQRSRLHQQSVEHLNIQGDHQLHRNLSVDWSGVYSIAKGSYPDWAELTANTGRILGANGVVDQTPELLAPLKRIWLHNSENEKDFAGNFQYKAGVLKKMAFEFLGGTLLRFKHRNNFYNYYIFTPAIISGNGQPFTNIYDAVWYNNGPQNPQGAVNTSGTYTANENILAWYGQTRFQAGKLKITAGIREEKTTQHVSSAADPGVLVGKEIGINYHDLLPSVHIGYPLGETQELKLSYFNAISRPSLYDITFFNMDYEDYNVSGNPFLRRSVANNWDLRYDLRAMKILNDFQLTVFYKRINDPYEKTLLNTGDTLYPIPMNGLSYTPVSKLTEQLRNYNKAINYGLELSVSKNFRNAGITANYTFTSSHIEQIKKYKQRKNVQDQSSDIITVTRMEQRPLQGQSKHLGNISLNYRLPRYGWTAQLVGVYTGSRINQVSGWYQLDTWQKDNVMIDCSIEKTQGKHWRFFAKASNLLNSGTRVYIKGDISGIPGQTEAGKIIIENESTRNSFLLGAQYKMK